MQDHEDQAWRKRAWRKAGVDLWMIYTTRMIDVGLKEWDAVCQLMGQGRWHVVLRKGGIHEIDGPGRFVLEHPRFVLFPSWLHQKPELLRDEHRAHVKIIGSGVEPAQLTLTHIGLVPAGCIRRVQQREQLDLLRDLHGWTQAQVDMRWNYKPENPMYVLALRVYRLTTPKTIANTHAYGGCRSWVPLSPTDAVDDTQAIPVVSNEVFVKVVQRLEGLST